MIETSKRPRQWRAWSWALLVGVVVTVCVHRHQFRSGFDLFPGPRGDTRLSAYVCEHWYRALHGQEELLSPPIFYPVKGTLGYSDVMLLFVPPYSLLRAVGLDIFTALAVVVVMFNFLNYVAGFTLLFHGLRLRWLPAVAGGMFFAFNNPKFSQPDHLQIQAVWLLAVIATCVILFFRDAQSISTKRAFWLLAIGGGALAVQLLTGFYLGWFLIFWSGLLLFLVLCARPGRDLLGGAIRRHWRPILAAAATTGAVLVPFVLIYLPVVRSGAPWPYRLSTMHIPDLPSYLLMAEGNLVWSWLTEALPRQAGGSPDWVRGIGIGLVPSLTWLVMSGLAVRTGTRQPFLSGAIMAVNLLILAAFQYKGHSLWHKVYEFVPGGKAIRDVARFMVVAALPMSIVFAVAVERADRWVGARWRLRVILVALIAFGILEQFNRGEGNYYSIHHENEWLQSQAARLPSGCTAFYVAGRSVSDSALDSRHNRQWMHDAMFVSAIRGVPTLNGRSGKSPPGRGLRQVTAPEYESWVREWIARHRVTGKICRLEIER
jgi:hypothetical protein